MPWKSSQCLSTGLVVSRAIDRGRQIDRARFRSQKSLGQPSERVLYRGGWAQVFIAKQNTPVYIPFLHGSGAWFPPPDS